MIDVLRNIRHKKIGIIGCLILLLLSIPSFFQLHKTLAPEKKPTPTISTPTIPPHIPDELIINTQEELTQNFLKTIPEEFDVVTFIKVFPQEKTNSLKNYYLLTFKKGADIIKAKAYLQKRREIRSTAFNHLMNFDAAINDPLALYQWPLQKIHIEEAWGKITERDSKVTVAVVDSGIDYNHEDFNTDVIKKGGNFTPGGGDKNGDPMDTNGHGTIVAGIIGATINNGKGIAGISKNPSILAVKVGGDNGISELDSIRGIESAIADGAKIVNMSFGHPEACPTLYQDFINTHKDIVFIAAAGNGMCLLPNGTYTNPRDCPQGGKIVGVDTKDRTPASCDGVIAVASTTINDARAESSNWGQKVALAAPGVNILSTKSSACSFCRAQQGVPTGYYIDNGTSFAAPHVSGVAALLLAKYPQLSPIQVKECLTKGGDAVQFDKPIGTRLNAAKALNDCPAILTNQQSTGTPTPTPTPTTTGEKSGKVICVPEGGMKNRFGSNILHITNEKEKEVKISYQSFLCPYKGIPLKEGDHCDDYKGGAVDTIPPGATKTYTLNIPSCTIGQLDIRVVNVATDIGCYQPDGKTLWDGGLAFAIQENNNNYNIKTNLCEAITPIPGQTSTDGLDTYGFLKNGYSSLATPTPRICTQPQIKCTNNNGSAQICSFTCI